MSCDNITRVHAFYDDEMSLSQRGEFEAHLQTCGDCRQFLAELRRTSALIAAAPLAEMPPAVLARLTSTWDSVRDRGVMRIAGWLTAAAAAILVGALLVWPHPRDEGLRAAAPWQAAAVMPPAEARDADAAPAELVVAAQWMANDLSLDQAR